MVEGGHHPRKRPPTLGTTSVDFYHYPVTVWAYSTPQPNTEVPAPTGGNDKGGKCKKKRPIKMTSKETEIQYLYIYLGYQNTELCWVEGLY